MRWNDSGSSKFGPEICLYLLEENTGINQALDISYEKGRLMGEIEDLRVI